MLTLSCDQVRQLDRDAIRQLGIPGILLMENAARGAAEWVMSAGPWTSIRVICGPGNNGGDGLALVRLLAAACLPASAVLIREGRPLSADADFNLKLLLRTGLDVVEYDSWSPRNTELEALTRTDLVVDALLGTGVRGLVSTGFARAIDAISRCGATVLALDVPSGLNCDTAEPCGTAVRAAHTVTFAAMKSGFLKPAAGHWTGTVSVAPIGLPEFWLRAWLERQRPD